MTHSEALLGDAGKYSRTLDTIQEIAGERFAGAWFTHVPEFGVSVSLTSGPIMSEAESALSKLELKVPTGYDAAYSERELVAAAESLSVIEHLEGVGVDSQLGGLFVSLSPPSETSSVLKELQDQINIPIRIETSGERFSDLAYGGTRLSVGCTTGFMVRNSANVRIYATAGHCPNPQPYALTPTGAATLVHASGPNPNVASGDSGGPWFSGGTAYGIHKGGPSTGWSGYGFFSKVSYLTNMGVSLP